MTVEFSEVPQPPPILSVNTTQLISIENIAEKVFDATKNPETKIRHPYLSKNEWEMIESNKKRKWKAPACHAFAHALSGLALNDMQTQLTTHDHSITAFTDLKLQKYANNPPETMCQDNPDDQCYQNTDQHFERINKFLIAEYKQHATQAKKILSTLWHGKPTTKKKQKESASTKNSIQTTTTRTLLYQKQKKNPYCVQAINDIRRSIAKQAGARTTIKVSSETKKIQVEVITPVM